jgi:hypothetical protein
MMTFQGSLKELHLPDVIQLVSVSGKTGCFHLEREGESGAIYLENGRIVHASLGKLSGEEAVYALSTWSEGTFHFRPGDAAPARTITKNNTNLLMEAARRMDEWRVLSKKIPSLDRVPRFRVPEGKQGQINLNTQEWLILSKIDGQADIETIAERLNLSTFEVAKLLYGLVTMGLIVLDAPAPRPAAEGHDEVEARLLRLVERLRDEAFAVLGEAGGAVVQRAFAEADRGVRDGQGTQAVQAMCQTVIQHAAQAGDPDIQRQVAERFRDILSSWNAGAF